jgi:hypothetical protein
MKLGKLFQALIRPDPDELARDALKNGTDDPGLRRKILRNFENLSPHQQGLLYADTAWNDYLAKNYDSMSVAARNDFFACLTANEAKKGAPKAG